MSHQHQIPKTQFAAVLLSPEQPIVIQHDVPVTQPHELLPGQCLVKMICTGVCHSDLSISRAEFALRAMTPIIGGHEGVGIVVAIAHHTETSPVKVGQRVGIKFLAYCCRDCEPCQSGLEQKDCANVQMSGMTTNGTFSQYVVSWVHTVTPIPESMDSFAVAPLLCAGVTVYQGLKYSNARIGNWVVIPGAGGGLGHLAVQYAVAMGMHTGAEKKKLCLDLGAHQWIDFKETPDLVRAIKNTCDGVGAHTALVTSPDDEGYIQAIDYLRPGATLMAIGLPINATFKTSIFWTVIKSVTIKGSLVGNRQDSVEAINIAATGKVKVIYALRGLTELQQVYDDIMEGNVAGRIVLDVSK